jgi:hypothetical protein
MTDQNTHHSSYREMLLEHLFVGGVMRHLWLRKIAQFEVLKPQVDDSGYDLVLEANGFVRHVQLKASASDSSTAEVKVSLRLAAKPSGCVIWMHFDPKTMELGPFLWYGGSPGYSLPDISKLRKLLAPIYGWFTEGFNTADLQEAKALLETLA